MTPSITRAPTLKIKIKFLHQFKAYLRVKHFIKNGDMKAPIAAPIVNTPIRNPLMADFCDSAPNSLIIELSDMVERYARQYPK